MFSGALKSFSSNITSNYTIAPQPSSISGPWKIFDAKHRKTNKAASIFIFDKKALDPPGGGLGGRSSAASLKRVHEEVVERLKKEASSLAKLRHPSILELAEPVEDTRNGGLMFATEPVTASLASLLHEKDEQERSGGVGGRGSRYVVEEADGKRKRRELEIDELEIQKGLLQLGKGLEFLHESAGLVHANLTPEAVMVNAKGDWKISGLSFCGPHESSTIATSLAPIQLSEVLNHDPRLPKSVQLNLDYTSPDLVLDNQLAPSADMFSLGLLVVALNNSPHASPLSTGGSVSTYKRLFSSSSSVPNQHNNFLVPKSHPLPPKLVSELLPRLITRRAADRMTAKEFQDASYFDNILVSTIRFLDALPAKTPNEKAQFMRGLPKIMPQFPKSVLEKKVLPALLEEMKDKELIAPVIVNAFAMVKVMPTGKRAFTEQVVPKLKEVFIMNKSPEKDTSKEAGLMVLLENMQTAAENCSGKEFSDDILPIILLALDSPTHALVDAALSTLPFVLPVLDFSTIKNDLFPVIAAVFAKTSSLNIKIRGLEAFYTLIGGSPVSESEMNDDLNGIAIVEKKKSSANSSAILDKYTVQEKIVPLLKGIKTKEPGVMMAALRVFKQVSQVADNDFLALEVLPILWSMSLGPLLNLSQFQEFMTLIKGMGTRIEKDQERKLREMRGGESSSTGEAGAFRRTPQGVGAGSMNGLSNGDDVDFESLVSGRKAKDAGNGDLMNDWGAPRPATTRTYSNQTPTTNETPMFSWQTQPTQPSQPTPTTYQPQQPSVLTMNALRVQNNQTPSTRAITPDMPMSAFAALTPASQFSQPLQPSRPGSSGNSSLPIRPSQQQSQGLGTGFGANVSPSASGGTSINWSAASGTNNPWASANSNPPTNGMSFGGTTSTQGGTKSPWSLSPPPVSPHSAGQFGQAQTGQSNWQSQLQGQARKSGLDKYESLL